MAGALLAERLQAPGLVGGTAPAGRPDGSGRRASGVASLPPFGDVLAARLGGTGTTRDLKFSSHALERIERRGIDLDGQALARLQGGVSRAAAKGSRESLVMVDDTAYIVSVRNRTVVTAVGREQMQEQVFTNIDSAVIA